MAIIPTKLLENEDNFGLEKRYGPPKRGKVCNIFRLDEGHLLVIRTNRVSIHDVVLPAEVRDKGNILSAMNIAQRRRIEFVEHDTIAYGASIDSRLPMEYRNNPELQKRATIVRQYPVLPYECVVRGFITGSGWKDYVANGGVVCGHQLPPNMHDGMEIPFPIFTPATKSDDHDINVTFRQVETECGGDFERASLQIYTAAAKHARERGIIIADTKFEFGWGKNTRPVLLDEALTPDSSRLWPEKKWAAAQLLKRAPAGLDKQAIREWGPTVGIKWGEPLTPEYLAHAHAQEVPNEVLLDTKRRYREAFYALEGRKLEDFQRLVMGIAVTNTPIKVAVLIGSDTDIDQIKRGLAYLYGRPWIEVIGPHVLSCDRHGKKLREFLDGVEDGTFIVAAAGMSARLPSAVATYLTELEKKEEHKKNCRVLGVGLKGTTPEADLAARLAIEQIPKGSQVYLNEQGSAYFGPEGFWQACYDVVYREFPELPPPAEDKLEPIWNVQIPGISPGRSEQDLG